jgi:hypothetical protein
VCEREREREGERESGEYMEIVGRVIEKCLCIDIDE